MKRFSLFLLVPSLLIHGCGGKSASSAPATNQGVAEVIVAWPTPAAGRIIPLAAQSIVVQLRSASGIVAAKFTIARPAASATSPKVKAGAYTLVATAYPTATGTGTAQAIGTGSVTIAANATTPADVTMASTVTTLAVTPTSLNPTVGDSVALAASATNGSAIVLIDPSTVHWTSSDPTVAMVDTSGLAPTLKAVKAGTATVAAQFTEVDSSLNQNPVNGSASVAVTVIAALPGPATSSWPMARGAVTNAAIGTGSGATGNVSAWTASTAAAPFSTYGGSVVIGQDNTLYASTADGHVAAINRTTGTQLWSVSVGTGISGLAATSSTIVYACNKGTLYAIDTTSRSVSWSFAGTTNGSNDASYAPAIGKDGVVYFADTGGNFYAVKNGSQKWISVIGSFNAGGITNPAGYARAALGTNGLIYVCGSGKLYALHNTTGVAAWAKTCGGSSLDQTCAPVIGSDGNVYLADNDGGGVYSLDGATGDKRWAVNTVGEHHGIAVSGGAVYLADISVGSVNATTRAFALSTSTGTQLWTTTVAASNGPRPGTPALAADGTIYVPGGTSVLYAVSSSGVLQWTHTFPSSAYDQVDTMAVDSDGTLYVTVPPLNGAGPAFVPGVIYAVR